METILRRKVTLITDVIEDTLYSILLKMLLAEMYLEYGATPDSVKCALEILRQSLS